MEKITIKQNHSQRTPQNNLDLKSKLWGMPKHDLLFLTKNNYTPISKIDLITGVLVGVRGTSPRPRFFSPWRLVTHYHAEDDLNYMYALINNTLDFPTGSSYNYFIMDIFGNILHSNCEISTTIDDNGIIHITSPSNDLDQLAYPATQKRFKHKCYYCCGANIQDLNSHISALLEKNLIHKPKNFKKGFLPTPETPITGLYVEK